MLVLLPELWASPWTWALLGLAVGLHESRRSIPVGLIWMVFITLFSVIGMVTYGVWWFIGSDYSR